MLETATKLCSVCDEVKSRDDFYREKSKDGRQTLCKRCADERARRWRETHPERMEELRRRRNRRTKSNNDWAKKHLPERRAQWAVHFALNKGELVRPTACSHCGREVRIEAHHDDYSKPLEVRWLCARCHRHTHMGIIGA